MSSDDDTFLSAYLDGQLEADQQHLVDSALVSSPELAERLRALTVVRDLVVGLHRESGVDVAPMVMSRIRRRRSRSVFSPFRPLNVHTRRAAAVAGILTAAAGFMLVVTVAAFWQPRIHHIPPAPRAPLDNMIAESQSAMAPAASTDSVQTIALQSRSASSPTAANGSVGQSAQPSAVGHDAVAIRGDGLAAPGDLEYSRKLLDNPNERRFFLIKDGRDGKAQQQVASVVERTTRLGFFKITISQGIVIDPRHPGEATVFALLVNPKELDRLRDQLKVALPDLEEQSADPGIVTQLADIRQVQELSPAPLGDVSISREALALLTRVGGAADNAVQSAPPAGQKVSGRPTAEQFRSAPLPTPGRSGTDTEHGMDLAAADEGSHAPETSAAAGAHSPEPIAGTEVAVSRPELAAGAAPTTKSDDMVLVFVWICKSRAG